jgi:thiamine-monophosphate kinase
LRKQPGVSGLGDDCAVLRVPRGQELLVTTDQLVEDVHFTHARQTAADCGWKAMARGLSDIAAMGGHPRWAFVSLTLSQSTDARWWRAFQRSLLKLALRYGVTLNGGDLSRAAKTYVDVMLLGTAPAGKALRRDGARVGDLIYVSGPLGRAASRHWKDRPRPRLELGRQLRGRASACIDLSDGLALDLHRLAKESGVAARLAEVPVFPGATQDQALHAGEDYELLCCAPSGRKLPGAFRPIGEIVAGTPGAVFWHGRVPPRGWDPFRHGLH